MITNAGGLGILCADACEAAGLELPELTEATRAALAPLVPAEASLANPIDLLGSATAGTYEAVIGHVLTDPNVDALVILFVPPVVAGANEVAAAISRAVAEVGPREAGDRGRRQRRGRAAARSAGRARRSSRFPIRSRRRGRWRWRPSGPTGCARRRASFPRSRGSTPRRGRAIVEAALGGAGDLWLDPAATQALLDAYGIPTVGERVAATRRRTPSPRPPSSGTRWW